jgi:hypothetical protein
MKSPHWHIKRVTSGTHHASEKVGLQLHTAKRLSKYRPQDGFAGYCRALEESSLRGFARAHRKSSVCDVKFKTITQQTDFQTSIP